MARPGSMEITKRDGMLVTLVVSLLFMTGFYFVLKAPALTSMTILAVMVGVILVLEKMDYLEHIFELFRLHRNFALLLVIAYILALPFLLRQGYLMHILILICIYATICLGINFQMGSTDMVNFAPAAFFGVGAYTSAMLTLRLGISPWLGFIGAIIMGVLIGYIVGAPTLKTKSYYLSLVTIAMQTIFYLMLMNTKAVGGPNGLPGVPPFTIGEYSFRGPFTLFGTTLPYQTHYFYLGAAILLLAAFFASKLYNSRVGLAWNAIAGDDVVAACQGINLAKAKLLAFCLGGAFASVAGVVYAHYMTYVGPDDFTFLRSLIILSMIILGGMDNIIGVIAGAAILTLVDQKLMDLTDFRMLAYGLVIVIMLLLRSEGLIPRRIRTYGEYVRIKPLWLIKNGFKKPAEQKAADK